MGVGHRVAYITVTENAIKWWVTVHGLNHHETRLLAEKVSDQPESHDDKEKVVEFSIPSWQVMCKLQQLLHILQCISMCFPRF